MGIGIWVKLHKDAFSGDRAKYENSRDDFDRQYDWFFVVLL
ncbi:MAG: hypothetical protein AB4352_02320 [Hormoscilla sp.]